MSHVQLPASSNTPRTNENPALLWVAWWCVLALLYALALMALNGFRRTTPDELLAEIKKSRGW